jgi:hypothetical protein
MKYDKPQIVASGTACTAVQGVSKPGIILENIHRPTTPAYEAVNKRMAGRSPNMGALANKTTVFLETNEIGTARSRRAELNMQERTESSKTNIAISFQMCGTHQ